MEQTVLEKNLSQISKYNKDLADKITDHTELTTPFEFLESKVGDIILSYDNIPLHDTVDPQEEALKIFSSIPSDTKSTIHVLFGLGLGYLFKRFSLSARGKIIVFEPNLDILRITLETIDFSEELGRKNIMLIHSKEEIQSCFDKFYFGDAEVTFSFLSSYARLYPTLLQEAISESRFVKGLYSSNYNNLFEQSRTWTSSGIVNLPEVLRHEELESLRGKFKGKPAVIISAGPSLNKNIDVLRNFQDNVVTFCVGPALKTTLKHGIKPDFLTIVECNDCSFQVHGLDISDLNVILQPMTHKSIHALNAKRYFNYYPDNDFTSKWLAKLIDIPLEDYRNKGTVSLCAVFSALIMGCDPIILMGQDLAYTEGKCYADDSPFKDLKLIKNEETGKYELELASDVSFADIVDPENTYRKIHESKGFPDINEIVKKKIASKFENLVPVKGQNGEILFTEPGYATFIRYFENLATEFKDKVKLINSTEGGAYLAGFEHLPLKSTLENCALNSVNTEEIIQEGLKFARNLHKEKAELILKEVDKTITLLDESISYFEDGKKHTEKLIKQYKLNRIHSDEFKKDFSKVLENFTTLEQKILLPNTLILGLIYPQYIKLVKHLQNDDKPDIESIRKFIDLAHDLFIYIYKRLSEYYIPNIKSMRERLYESCYTKS